VRSIFLICRKELKSYFVSPIAYAVLADFALVFGAAFYVATSDLARFLPQAQMQGQPLNLNQQVIGPLLGFAGTVGLFLLPMIAMRLFAEEKRSGTIELLLTSPVSDLGIVVGKWLGAMALYACVLGMSMLSVVFMFIWGKPDLGPVLVAYLGLLLQGGCLLALGTWISTTTKDQIVAVVVTFHLSLLLWMLSWFTAYSNSIPGQVANYMSIVTHMENFSKGVVDLKDVVFYITFTFFGLFCTMRSLESLRWRS